MDETQREVWLRIVLRVLCVGFLVAFVPWITLILLDAPILAPGSSIAPLLRFQPYNAGYESMLAAIYMVWAVMLWRSSANPAQHRLFIRSVGRNLLLTSAAQGSGGCKLARAV